MPTLNWNIFNSLSGSPERNFEALCRGIVRLNFGSYGTFRALANQPGVEFHLRLSTPHPTLGEEGRWWGWQCKWYDLPASGSLGTKRRRDIQEGIEKTELYLPHVTDWVLCTRRTLAKADEQWFHNLSSKMTLHLWSSDDLESFLVGHASVLRSTYFGELVISPEILGENHEQSVAIIKTRWQPHVHHVSETERELRCMLGEVEAWSSLDELLEKLILETKAMESAPKTHDPYNSYVKNVIESAKVLINNLNEIKKSVKCGDLEVLFDVFLDCSYTLSEVVSTAPRKLRTGGQVVGLHATNLIATCRDAIKIIHDIKEKFSSRLVAVLAPAGYGKTHLAAQITSSTKTRPHGIFFQARDLCATHTIDDLARRISITTEPVSSMEKLVAAVNAAGQRAGARLPIFIDGLNESEDPRLWKPILASLKVKLTKYPYVLVICSLRPDFIDDALPEDVHRLEMSGYGEGESAVDAVRKHFTYWKINAADGPLPKFLSHPLTLRFFCEVTNPTREQMVGVAAMPSSLTSLFERYLDQVSIRVADLASRSHRFYSQDVKSALIKISLKLWTSRTRSIEITELREILDDAQRPWNNSIVRALEHEGILLRMPSNAGDTFMPVYDLLGGHIIASAILIQNNQTTFESWIRDQNTMELLIGSYSNKHPLAGDILAALVGQVPRRFYSKQVWQLVVEPLRSQALRLSAHLEPQYLDLETVEELIKLFKAGDPEIIYRFFQTRSIENHPLNSNTLDQALRDMSVADRDIKWTEWVRKNSDVNGLGGEYILKDIEMLSDRWKKRNIISGDNFRASWVMWMLTSTIRKLRDQATCALYWFGRNEPENFFELTINSLSVNDPYVSERMLASAYGVVMSHQKIDADFKRVLKPFIEKIASGLIGQNANAPTQHYLTRQYALGIILFTMKFYPDVVPVSLSNEWCFASPTQLKSIVKGDPRVEEVSETLHMDFENYTLGSLFDDRRNYDMNHEGHQAAVAYVYSVVWSLGWRAALFREIDSNIATSFYRHGRGDQAKVERYGKKYCRIGYFQYAGFLDDQNLLSYRYNFSDFDIDPSFPERPITDGCSQTSNKWLSIDLESHEDWIANHNTSLPMEIVFREKINEIDGPWLAVHGFIKTENRVFGRKAWGCLAALIVSDGEESDLIEMLRKGVRPWVTNNLPEDYHTFAGEIPWHPIFACTAVADNSYFETVSSNGKKVEVEIVAHEYGWESYRSELNNCSLAYVPSKIFSQYFNLYGMPQSFNQYLPDGTLASVTLSNIDGFDGHILYIREDLLRKYIGNRKIVWYAFGERQLSPYPSSPPEWLIKCHHDKKNSWHQVATDPPI